MHVPESFAMDEADIARLLLHAGAGDLVTAGPTGLQATLLPFVFDASVGPHGALRGHVARHNDQGKALPQGEALVIFRGPDAYVTPSWYPSKQEHGRVVPTWNYVTAHVYGELRLHDDVDFVRRSVLELTAKHEAGRERPWSVDDAPATFIEGQLRAIVGVEVLISRVVAKAKLSQNRPGPDIDGVIDGLRHAGEERMAEQVTHHRPART